MNTLEVTAHHEAGHVVAAIAERVALRSATIVPTEDAAGLTLHRNLLVGRDIECDASPANRLRMERVVRVCLAGPAVEDHLGVRGPDTVIRSGWDEDKAIEFISYFTGSIEETEAYYRLLDVQVRQFLKEPGIWAQVTAIAEALLLAQTLPGRQLRDIARKALFAALEEERRRLTER